MSGNSGNGCSSCSKKDFIMMAQNMKKLSRTNYMFWVDEMKVILELANIDDVLDSNFDGSKIENQWKDKFLYELLIFAVDDEHRVHVKKSDGGRKSWDALQNFFSPKSIGYQVHLIVKILSNRMEYGSDIRIHINRMLQLFAELAMTGHVLEENIKVTMLMNSLSDEYDPVVSSLDYWSRADVTVESLIAKLIDEYDKKYYDPQAARLLNSGRLGPPVNKVPRHHYGRGGAGRGNFYKNMY